MECKFCSSLSSLSRFEIELIDTLWNVNTIMTQWFKMLVEELIDTLWNVNSMPTQLLNL